METRQWAALLPVLLIGAWTIAPSRMAHRRLPISGLLLLTGCLLLSCCHYKSCQQQRQAYMSVITEGETVTASGQLYKKEWKNSRLRLYLKDCRLLRQEGAAEMTYSCNRLLAYSDADAFCIDDTLEINGQIHMFDEAVNEGMFDSAVYYASMGIDFALYSSGKASWQGETFPIRIRTRPVFSTGELLYRIRQKLTAAVSSYLPETEAGVLSSILFGDKTSLDEEEKTLYQTAGISHILAISGLHISLLGMGLYRLLRRGGVSFMNAGTSTGILLILYAILTGGSLSTRRAVGMLLLTMAGQVFGRRTDMLNSLGLVLMVLLWENPFLILSSSLYFTLASIGGIAITGTLLTASHGSEIPTGKEKAMEALEMSVAIQLTVLPVTACCYSEVPLLSVFQNLLVLPLLTPLLILGMAGSAAGTVSMELQRTVEWPLSGLAGKIFDGAARLAFLLPCQILGLYHRISSLVTSLPIATFTSGKPPLYRCILFYILLGGVLLYLWTCRERQKDHNGSRRGPTTGNEEMKNRSLRIRTGLMLVLILPLLLLARDNTGVEIDVLDVGQGDGIYINAADGTSFFIDGGSTTVKEVGKYRILPFLKARGTASISCWFISHMDQDHMNGMMELLESGYPIQRLVLAEAMPRDEAFEELCRKARQYGSEVCFMKAGDSISAGSTVISCLFPDDRAAGACEDANDLSLTLLLECRIGSGEVFRALFTGDLAEKGEAEVARILQSRGIDRVNYYKVGHHGSKFSSSEELLAVMQADIAVISCGAGNRYGHPSPEAVERLRESGCRIYYTMYGGEIMTRYRQHSIEVGEYRKKKKVFSDRESQYGH